LLYLIDCISAEANQ